MTVRGTMVSVAGADLHSLTSAHDIAAELRRREPTMGLVKLHKLLYYVQGWHLAWTDGERAFAERIEAWTNGPVVADLWRVERYGGPLMAPRRPLDDRILAVIDFVWDRYGRCTGKELIRLTHGEDPWVDVSESESESSFRNAEITPKAMQAWFEHDTDRIRLAAEAERLRRRQGRNPFLPPPVTADRVEALDLARRGPVRHARPV